jgi:hypothetical protein
LAARGFALAGSFLCQRDPLEREAASDQMNMTTTAPYTVSRFEASLIRLLRSFLRHAPGEATAPMAAGKLTPPKCLCAACIHLVRDSLSKGCVEYLARAGGWRREKHLRKGESVLGRLWERSPAKELGLSFSVHSLNLLVWLTAGRPEKLLWDPPAPELTVGDQFLLFLAYESLREQEAGIALRGRVIVQQHGLIQLFFPEDFVAVAGPTSIEFAAWTKDTGACIVEALQPRLHQSWLSLERSKIQIGDWTKMRQLGLTQDRVLAEFLQKAKNDNRPDLARFLLKAMAELLSADLTPNFWLGGLQGSGPPRLAERLEVQRSALAVLRQFEQMGQWTKWAGSVSFIAEEEHYPTAQLWLADWEHYRGKQILPIAQNLLRQVEPLRQQAGGSGASAEPVPGVVGETEGQ